MTGLTTGVPGWALWPDFAIRSAGFPVAGLDAFGPGDETARLREVARDPRFREAVTWQNPAALANAVLKVADASPTRPSRARQREEVVASYWQRYCAKNDTIGFFGPLAWGRFTDDGPSFRSRSGPLVRERSVHLESWGVQALAQTLDPDLAVASGPRTEDELRAALLDHPDPGIRERGLAALDRLEASRDALTVAPPAAVGDALAALDRTFVELTGREPVRNHGRAYGARTLAYVDCMRDLDVTIGPGLVADLAPGLQVLFEAGRWYCGQINAMGQRVVEEALATRTGDAFEPLLGAVVRALMQPAPDVAEEIRGTLAEMHRRLAAVVADPDPATVGARAAAAFADRLPTWRLGAFGSADLQIAAAGERAVAAGDYLAVVGDVHPGGNPLMQGVFANRHPDLPAMLRGLETVVGPGAPVLLPPFTPTMGVEARGFAVTPHSMVHIGAMPHARAQAPRRTWLAQDLRVDGGEIVDRGGDWRLPALDVFGFPIFVSGVRAFDLLPAREHAPRVTLGRTVLQRESWTLAAADVPQRAEDVPAFARDRGMPRRVFAKSPLERKPMYVDVESPVLCRILCRHVRQAAEAGAGGDMTFTEMLPGPDACWLADPDGNRYVSELRIVAVDESRRR